MYDKSFGPNKRPHIKETSRPTTSQNQGCRKKSGKKGRR